MSFEKKLNKRLLTEAPAIAAPPRQIGKRQANLQVARPTPPAAAPKAPAATPQQGAAPDFAAVRRSMRRPMVALDAAVHKIDSLLNQTQQDPSNLTNTVTQIEQSFNAMLKPLNAVKSGVADLRNAANSFNAEYTGVEFVGQGQPQQQQQTQEQKFETPGDEDKFFNKVATDIEQYNREEDRLYAAKQGFEAYRQHGGKMNRGEFFRRLVQKLRLPETAAQTAPQRQLPNVGATKRSGETGRRTGELQFKPTRTAPIESYAPTSAQRRVLREANFGSHGDPYDPVIPNTTKSSIGGNKQYNLGKLPTVPNEDRLINKVVTEIEMVNNWNDKKTAFRNGWLDYQSAGGALSHGEFVKAVTNKLKMARSN